MSKALPTPDRLFDRTWRPGNPFRPRAAYLRRVILYVFFSALLSVICAYLIFTDSHRVRRMAEDDLSKLLGGNVKVGTAHLSIFQGLRLDEVQLYADSSRSGESMLFRADSFLIEYNPLGLLWKRIDATRIIAVGPEVRLWEDTQTRQSNLSRWLESRRADSLQASAPDPGTKFPEIILRNAKVRYTRVEKNEKPKSSIMAIEGKFQQSARGDSYSFVFQSRGNSSELGPMVEGQMSANGQVTAKLQNFEFGQDINAMLPWDVKKWTDEHKLTGRLDVPTLTYTPRKSPQDEPGYLVEIRLDGVKLEVNPELWTGEDEKRNVAGLMRAFDAMRDAGLDQRGFVAELSGTPQPRNIALTDVIGKLTFSNDKGIKIEDLHGRLEDIPFVVSGTINGYDKNAAANIHIASPKYKNIEIPAVPRYVDSLPPAVREIYDRLKPRGICGFELDLVRSAPGQATHVTGKIEIVDGNFVFDKFPYPMRKATGHLILTYDPRTGEDSLVLDRVRGRGVLGGPNQDRLVTIDGRISPFGPGAEVDIRVSGQAITSEPALIAAFPEVTRKALAAFDAPGKGEFPKFGGDFICQIKSVRGRNRPFFVETNIHLDDASGALAAFPYPMRGINGDLRIYEDHVELVDINMKKGEGTLRVDGKIWWPRDDKPIPPGTPLLRPNLVIAARDVPVDRDLLAALPEAQRVWLERVGAGGRLDLNGTIKPADIGADPDELRYDLNLTWRDGTLWPVDGTFAVSDVQGNLRLKNQRLIFSELRGRRGAAELMARGEIAWPDDNPSVVLQAEARDLTLDAALHKVLPEVAQAAWDQVRPEGTVDVSLNYTGAVSDPAKNDAAQGKPQADGFELVITPRKLSVTPAAVPYRLDELTGSVRIIPDRVELRALSGRHGNSNLRFAGSGSTGRAQLWNLTLSSESVPVDDDLLAAVPAPLADLLKSLEMKGKLGFDFDKLRIAVPSDPKASSELDFSVKLQAQGASLDVGVPFDDVKGVLSLTGQSRKGKLANLDGKLDLESLTLAGRTVTGFSAKMAKPSDVDKLLIRDLKATLARGSMAGDVDYTFSDNAPSSYAVNLYLRNSDVRELTGETEREIQGALSASLALEGTVDKPATRRGRGDVSVNGENMYRIPLVLGLLQVTNLSLPITSPFKQASARYSIDGRRVTFEQIELRSNNLLMQGDGALDFGTKQVKMRFVTDSTTWPKVPFIGDFIEGARHDLFQIHVRGTLQEPKVSARAMNTLTTTVDEVLRGDEKPTTAQRK